MPTQDLLSLSLEVVLRVPWKCDMLFTGVSDMEEAEGLLDFAKRFEIIRKAEISNLKLAEVDFLDEESISAGIPK